MPFRTSLLLSLSVTSFLNSVLASSHINPHKHQECQSFKQLLDSFPDGSLHDTLADGIPGFEHTIFGNDREAAQALHDVDHEAAMKMLSVAHVDLVRRQIVSSAAGLPASLAASVGVSVPTSLPEVIPTAAVSMPQSSAAPVVVTTQEVTSIVSVMPSSAPIASSAPPSAAPPSSAPPSAAPPSSIPSSSDAASVAPVPISTTEAAPPPTTTSEIIMSSTSAPPQESSGTTSPSDVAPVPVPSSTTPTSVGSTSFVQSTSASEALPSGSAGSSAVPMSSGGSTSFVQSSSALEALPSSMVESSAASTSPGGFVTSSPAAGGQTTGTTIASATSSLVDAGSSSAMSIVFPGSATSRMMPSGTMSSGSVGPGSSVIVVVPPVQSSDVSPASTLVTTDGSVNTALSPLGPSDVMQNTETAMVTSTPGSTATSAIGAFPTAGSAMTTLTSSDFINLSSFAAPTSQAPVASSTPDATSAAVGGGGVVDGGSSSAAVVAPTSNQGGGGSPSTTAASNGNGGTGNNGGTGGAGGAGGNGGTGSNGGSDSGSVTTTDEFGDTLVVPSTTDGAVLTLTDSGGRVITTTYHPGGLARETRVLSSRLPGGGQTLITSVAYVNPSAASGIDGVQPSIATRTRGQAGLQTGNVADTTRRAGAEALALAVGAMGVAWAL